MRASLALLLLVLLTPLSHASGEPSLKGCFLLEELESGKVISESDPSFCSERAWACSSFKVALAAMGFDSGVLKDENTTFKWDGTRQPIKTWERDHSARTWLEESVVWYSRKLTPLLGLEKIGRYLKDFQYGNRDFSGGLTRAWLSSTLKISPREQVAFLRRLARKQLKITEKAAEQTLALLPVALDGADKRVAGKTGSGFSWQDQASRSGKPFRVGWYVGYATVHGRKYAFAALLRMPSEKGKLEFAGGEARRYALGQIAEIERTQGL
jgi:beta-lactamase class D